MISVRRARKKIRSIRVIIGHTCVHTTEIYADVVMENKADAVNLTNGLFD
jgi:site-specific recombinase XerD